MKAVIEHAPCLGVRATCSAFAVAPASYYRHLRRVLGPRRPRPSPPRSLSVQEREAVLQTLHEPRFVDQAPAEVFATQLDEGHYQCSLRTLYRILAANEELRERRNQLRHPSYSKPELLATGPNQLWSWDITKVTTRPSAPGAAPKIPSMIRRQGGLPNDPQGGRRKLSAAPVADSGQKPKVGREAGAHGA